MRRSVGAEHSDVGVSAKFRMRHDFAATEVQDIHAKESQAIVGLHQCGVGLCAEGLFVEDEKK